MRRIHRRPSLRPHTQPRALVNGGGYRTHRRGPRSCGSGTSGTRAASYGRPRTQRPSGPRGTSATASRDRRTGPARHMGRAGDGVGTGRAPFSTAGWSRRHGSPWAASHLPPSAARVPGRVPRQRASRTAPRPRAPGTQDEDRVAWGAQAHAPHTPVRARVYPRQSERSSGVSAAASAIPPTSTGSPSSSPMSCLARRAMRCEVGSTSGAFVIGGGTNPGHRSAFA